MKRTLSLILVLILALTLSTGAAFAKTSKTRPVDVDDEPSTPTTPVVEPPVVEPTTVPVITEEIASGILGRHGMQLNANDLEVIWQKEVTPEEGSDEVTLHADGASEENPFHVFKWNGNEWEYVMTVTTEDFTLKLNGTTNIALVLEKPEVVTAVEPGETPTSPKTGESRALAALAFTAVAASAAYVALRKEDK